LSAFLGLAVESGVWGVECIEICGWSRAHYKNAWNSSAFDNASNGANFKKPLPDNRLADSIEVIS
jgi:hypothetical protein